MRKQKALTVLYEVRNSSRLKKTGERDPDEVLGNHHRARRTSLRVAAKYQALTSIEWFC